MAMHVGNTMTVDTKMQTISQNIVELMDPDLYDDSIDKAKILVLQKYDSKLINAVSTKLWQRESGRNVELSGEELKAAQALEKILTDNGIEVTPGNINIYLQKGFKDLAKVSSVYQLIEGSNVTSLVRELQDMLMPTGEVAAIFGEMGEEFRPQSGVLALSEDMDFLEQLIAKAEKNDLLSGSDEEK